MAQDMGYYCVRLEVDGLEILHRVYARSDFDAALRVRNMTGFMARSQNDVVFLPEESGEAQKPPLSHSLRTAVYY